MVNILNLTTERFVSHTGHGKCISESPRDYSAIAVLLLFNSTLQSRPDQLASVKI
jgi:hypothetical protein